MSELRINGLLIPSRLERLIRNGCWAVPTDERIIVEVFGEPPEWPCFYGLSEMVRQNELWRELYIDDISGEPVEGVNLGIDLQLSVVIGDLGADNAIALDYRTSTAAPCVLYLKTAEEPAWVQVASDVDELICRLYG